MKKNNLPTYQKGLSLGLVMIALSACATCEDAVPSPPIFKSTGPEQVFSTPERASTALVEANRHNDIPSLLRILGPNGKAIVNSGDKAADRDGRMRFVAAYDKAHHLEDAGDNKKELIIGDEQWPLPIPLIQIASNGWQFDTEAGEEEILDRRIGRNELNAIRTCRAYVDAQREYAELHHAPDGAPQYAERFISRKGQHDGLYWPTKPGEAESPLGPLIARAQTEDKIAGNQQFKREPHKGYYYKILKEQGANAFGGAGSYVVDSHMTSGFALIVFPAKYGDSGVMTFIVGQNGIVFEKNLGPESTKIAAQITEFNPDDSWEVVTDQ